MGTFNYRTKAIEVPEIEISKKDYFESYLELESIPRPMEEAELEYDKIEKYI
jgi:hypothetical protein